MSKRHRSWHGYINGETKAGVKGRDPTTAARVSRSASEGNNEGNALPGLSPVQYGVLNRNVLAGF